jgi:hypothetical protein
MGKSKQHISGIRQRIVRLAARRRATEGILLSHKKLLKGTVVEVARTCGKPGCKCTRGQKHPCYQLSASIQGKTRTRHLPQKLLDGVKRLTETYRYFRKARAEWVKINSEMLELINELESARRKENLLNE